LAGPHARLEARLRIGRRALEHAAIVEGEDRAVPGAAQRGVAFHRTLRQRAAEVRATIADRVDATVTPHERDRHPVRLHATWLSFFERVLAQHGDEVLPG